MNLKTALHKGLCLIFLLAASVPAAGQGDDADLRQAAEQGDANAQAALGMMYAEGEGVRQDYAEAAKWWRRAAEQGHVYSQGNLGMMYNRGQWRAAGLCRGHEVVSHGR